MTMTIDPTKPLDCGHTLPDSYLYTVHDDKTYCPTCDKLWLDTYMQRAHRVTLYLVQRDKQLYLNNWTGELEIKIDHWKYGKHNMVGKVTHVWFKHAGIVWHGVNYGDDTQLCHCKKTKRSTF